MFDKIVDELSTDSDNAPNEQEKFLKGEDLGLISYICRDKLTENDEKHHRDAQNYLTNLDKKMDQLYEQNKNSEELLKMDLITEKVNNLLNYTLQQACKIDKILSILSSIEETKDISGVIQFLENFYMRKEISEEYIKEEHEQNFKNCLICVYKSEKVDKVDKELIGKIYKDYIGDHISDFSCLI
jgi:hypothetical protein